MTTFGGGLIAESATGTYSFDGAGVATSQMATLPTQSWQGNSYQIGSVQSVAVSWWAPGVPLYASFVGGYPSGQGTSPICRDDRDRLTAEYVDPRYKADFLIPCNRFVSAVQFSIDHPGTQFDFATLNGSEITHDNYPDFGLFEKSLLDGLGLVQANYGNQPLVVGSAFRSPKVNQQVEDEQHAGRHPNGRHIYGDAVDLESGMNLTVWTDLFRAANGPGLQGACVEPFDVSKVGHVHIDWRPKGMVRHNCLPKWLVK